MHTHVPTNTLPILLGIANEIMCMKDMWGIIEVSSKWWLLLPEAAKWLRA